MFEFTLPDTALDIALLLIRIIVGITFILGAQNKSKNIRKFAKGNGIPVPMAVVVTFGELFAGLGVLLGILPQIVAAGLMLLMLNTISIHVFKWHSSYWASKGGWEYDLMLFAFASIIFILGAGQFSPF